MDQTFTIKNREVLALAMERRLTSNINGFSVVIERSDFAVDYYNPNSELIQSSILFKAFYDLAYVQGHTLLLNALTPADFNAAYIYLKSKDVQVD